MPLQATSGAASYDAFGGGVAAVPQYIEDVFSTWLYTGNGSTQTINNGIDLAGKGGLVWTKTRNVAQSHQLVDTVRGQASTLISNSTNAAAVNSAASSVSSFSSNGYVAGVDFSDSTRTYVSWTFREAPKFFDVIVHTAGTPVVMNHNLGSVPGCIISKGTTAADFWNVVHRGTNGYTFLNATDAADGTYQPGIGSSTASAWVGATATTVDFSNIYNANTNFVVYLFAHNAGGFGLTGTDNVISCGSYTGNGDADGPVVTLGYEPQWLLIKSTGVKDWIIYDTMRGLTVSDNNDEQLFANTADPTQFANRISPTATGFKVVSANADSNSSGVPYIYIAIRRGPMRTPTAGTQVYATDTAGGTLPNPPLYNSGWPVDLGWFRGNMPNAASNDWYDRLRGQTQTLFTNNTSQEEPFGGGNYSFDSNTGWSTQNFVQSNSRAWMFRRAPGFFDEVCYTGTGSARTVTHNLAVVPELIIVKSRSDTSGWRVYSAALGAGYLLQLSSTAAAFDDSPSYTTWNNTTPTSSVFSVGAASAVNGSGTNYVAYLFATCPGVSKVFNYTGNGSSQTINCGFTGGARFVMIKRTDSTGDWYVWDSARGIVSGNDPRLSLNTTAAEVTTDDSVDTDSTGFVVNQLSATNINVSSATYIGIAIA